MSEECASCGYAPRNGHAPHCLWGHTVAAPRPERVLDLEEGRRRRDEGMRRAEAGVDDAWRSQASMLLAGLARRQRDLTADDLWSAGLEQPPSGSANALGSIFTAAVRAGVLEDSGMAMKSARPGNHARRMPIWRSLVYRRAAS